ncbi:MAG: hypothetical protein ACXWM2_04925 [Parachlamydiaceae bacterium]
MDARTQNDIEKRTWKVLQDAGLTEPPVKIDEVIEFLKLHIDYYSLEDPSFLQNLFHRFDVKSHKILEAVKKSKIVAAWYPENSKILIDNSLADAQKTFPKYHEVLHSILPWHQGYFLGDTAQTLSLEYQESLELEANYGASELWFSGPTFRTRCKDFPIAWETVPKLKEMFGTTLTTTMWKFVVSQEIPVIGVVSIPIWKWDGKEERCRYLITSPSFARQFSKVSKEIALAQFENKIAKRSGGPLGNYEAHFVDTNGDLRVFKGQTFFNRHDLLTLFVCVT